MKFENLDLLPTLRNNLLAVGYSTPTQIQAEAIPPALRGSDILGTARTGTGKTAAFALPILHRLDGLAEDVPKLRALVLTPTRELAAQVSESLTTYGKGLDLWHTVVFGGVNIKSQIRSLRQGVDILVATPGRLLDLLRQRALTLEHIKMFVLDEADRMLDMGFLPDVRRIIQQLPHDRQTLMFSATLPPEIRRIADELLTDPAVVSVHPTSSAADAVLQQLYFVERSDKQRLLIELLKDDSKMRTLVFTRTKHGANRLTRHLVDARVNAVAIHGNKSQSARTKALEGFRNGNLRVLVATDVAARGIDVDNVSHVINFDIPNVAETYVHRIGRTGRAGRTGIALSFCDIEERPYLVAIERLMGKHVDRIAEHPFPSEHAPPAPTHLAGHGKSPSPPRGPHDARRKRGPGGHRRKRHGRRQHASTSAAPQRRSVV